MFRLRRTYEFISRCGWAAALISTAALFSARADAGGGDAYLWYSARHLGVGGAAVGYVSDPSAVFHNPAGLGHLQNTELLVAAGLLVPQLRASPAEDVNRYAEPLTAPFGLVGVGTRLTDWAAVGFAVYPIAAAGASYRYEGVVGDTRDETRAVLVEASPALAFSLPYGVRLGAGLRATWMSLERYSRGTDAEQPGIDMALSGVDWGGLRLGAQWGHVWRDSRTERESIEFGASYRHTVEVALVGSGGYALATRLRGVETTFVLPARAAFGFRGDWHRVGVTADFEYGFNSQNSRTDVHVELEDGREARLPNIFEWQDTVGIRGGLEYRAGEDGRVPIRVGYAFDGATVTARYPTAFGPPPASTQMLTAGVGFVSGPWEFSAAYSYRFGAEIVTEADVEDSDLCAFCGFPGEYAMRIQGIYLDVSYQFGE